MTTTLVLADAAPLFLYGLVQLFGLDTEFEVQARCATGAEALAAVRRLRPDLLVADLHLPDIDGVAVLRTLRTESSPTRVVLMTEAIDRCKATEAFRLGVGGMVVKRMPLSLILDGVRTLRHGTPGRARRPVRDGDVLRAAGWIPSGRALSARERQVTLLVAAGLRNKEIATRLTISEGTVKLHLHHVYAKLDVRGRPALRLYARENGLA